jgi:hypothetical protein
VVAFLPPDRYLEVSSETARLLRLVNGERDVRMLAELASVELSMQISPAEFHELLERRLVPCGLIRYGQTAPAVPRSSGRRRIQFIPRRAVAAIAMALGFLYRPPVAAIAVAASVGSQLWYFFARAGPPAGAEPAIVRGWLAVIALYMVSMLAHEIGHAAALRTFGVAPGPIGIDATSGVPRWSSSVAGIWRLGRRQRVIVDLGGVYLQSLFVAALILFHGILPGLVPGIVLARTVVIVDVIILFSLAPRWWADGFWLAADLAGTRYPRVEASTPGDRGPEQVSRTGRAPGVYGGPYALLASAGFAGLFVWLSGHPGFDTSLRSTSLRDGAWFVSLSIALVLKALVLTGLALSIWTGIAWLAGATRNSARAGTQTRPDGGA